jgi:hypothetical protein
MPEEPEFLQQIVSKLGVSQESTRIFKFGGVVGKLAIVALGGFLATVGVAKYTSGTAQIISIVCVLAVTLVTVRWILNYAEKHPISATLEGGEMVLWQQQVTLAAKGQLPPRESPVIPDPEGSPPQAIVPVGDDA